MIASIDRSNKNHIEYTLRRVVERKKKNIGILGLSFKAGTDDLRNSPMVTLSELLIGKGYNVRIYDGNINLSRLLGANKEYLSNHLPHFNSLLSEELSPVLELSDLVIINHRDNKFIKAVLDYPEKDFFDLVGLFRGEQPGNCEGICW